MVINPHWPPLADGTTQRRTATIEYLRGFPAATNLPFPMGIKDGASDIWLLQELYERKQTMWKLCRDFLFSIRDIYCSLCGAVLQGGPCCIGARCSLHGRHRASVTGSFISPQMEAVQAQCGLNVAACNSLKDKSGLLQLWSYFCSFGHHFHQFW